MMHAHTASRYLYIVKAAGILLHVKMAEAEEKERCEVSVIGQVACFD